MKKPGSGRLRSRSNQSNQEVQKQNKANKILGKCFFCNSAVFLVSFQQQKPAYVTAKNSLKNGQTLG